MEALAGVYKYSVEELKFKIAYLVDERFALFQE
jgi:hypothetical protein